MAASPMRSQQRPMSAPRGAPIVVKADGLAAGKGRGGRSTLREAEDAVAMMFDGAFVLRAPRS